MYNEPDVLIARLEFHLKHAEAILSGKTVSFIDHDSRLVMILDKLKIMLALIKGAREE